MSVAHAGESPVHLAPSHDLAEVVHPEQGRHRRPVDVLDAAGALDRGVRALGGIALVLAESHEGVGEMLRSFGQQQGHLVRGAIRRELHHFEFADEVLGRVEDLVEIGREGEEVFRVDRR